MAKVVAQKALMNYDRATLRYLVNSVINADQVANYPGYIKKLNYTTRKLYNDGVSMMSISKLLCLPKKVISDILFGKMYIDWEHPKWTYTQHDDLVDLVNQGKSVQHIARHFKTSAEIVQARIGIIKNEYRVETTTKFGPAERELVDEMWSSGMSEQDVHDQTHYAMARIKEEFKRLDLLSYVAESDMLVEEMRAAYDNGIPQAHLAKMFGVSLSVVNRRLNERNGPVFKRWTPEEDELIIKYVAEGMKYEQIGRKFKVSKGSVRARIGRLREMGRVVQKQVKQ